MSRRVLFALAAAMALGAGGCATSSTEPTATSSPVSSPASSPVSPTGTTSNAAVCQAADHLRSAIDALAQIDVIKQGTSAVQQAFGQVKSGIAELASAAKDQYGPQLRQVQTASDAVQSALDQAKSSLSAQTLGALATAVHTLVQDTRTLLTAVGASC
jgi:hypothetical protein